MKVYVITIDEVYDFETFNHTPRVFTNKDKAREAFEEISEQARIDYAKDGWEEGYGADYYEMWPDGSWGTSHYGVYLQAIETE